MADVELDHFKRTVNLSEVAATQGYALDRQASSRHSAVMRHANGDKIVIAKNAGSGDWMYFSVRDDRDHGTVIDFLQHRGVGNLGEVRKTLRAWLGTARLPVDPTLYRREMLPVSSDRTAVIVAWARADACDTLPYLARRGLGPEVLTQRRFAGCLRVDARHNVLFPHYDTEGLCGYEIKNTNFTGFAPQGVKGLWSSQIQATDTQLVVTESAIDALSFHALHGGDTTRYVSTGGTLNKQQPVLLRQVIAQLPAGGMVLLAFDADAGGEKLRHAIEALVPEGQQIQPRLPTCGKDWNDVLREHLGLA